MKITHGILSLANSNNSRTLAAPTPTYFSWNSLPETAIKLAFASPAKPLANNVLPLPGGPSRINPFGEIKIRLEIVRPPAERPHIDHLHGRHARYSYASTQISPVIEMEKGTESFNSELMNASHSIRADITDSTALLREKNLTTSELPKYQIKIP